MGGKPLRRKSSSLLLQPRDIEILKDVFHYRFLTGEQVKNLGGFKSHKRSNDRLRKLFDAGFLSRRVFVDGYSRQILHLLGPKAVEVLSPVMNIDPLGVRRKRVKALQAKNSFLGHVLMINNFRYSLEMVGRFSPAIKLDFWKNKPPLFVDEEVKVFPDSYFIVKSREKTYSCFLEIDRSVESRQRIKRKIEVYLDYGLNGHFEKRYGVKYFRLLIVCKTMARLKSLLKIIQKITDKSFVWLTTAENITPDRISQSVWHRSNKEEVSTII